VAGGWRKSEYCILKSFTTCTLHQILIMVIKLSRIRWLGHVACMGEMINAYKTSVRKPEEKIPLGRLRHS
jgi:hypothetical protein